jgi:hypothetical protein
MDMPVPDMLASVLREQQGELGWEINELVEIAPSLDPERQRAALFCVLAICVHADPASQPLAKRHMFFFRYLLPMVMEYLAERLTTSAFLGKASEAWDLI